MTRRFRIRAAVVIGLGVLLLGGAVATAQDELIGFWEWDYTYGGFAGERFDPESVGHTRQLEFRADGTALSYRDEILHETGSWTGTLQFTVTGLEDFRIDDAWPDLHHVDTVRYLDLVEPCCDRYEFHFHERGIIVGRVDATFGSVKALYR